LQRTVTVLLANPSNDGKKILRQISALLVEMQSRLHQAALDQELEPDDKDSRIEPPLSESQKMALQVWLRNKFTEPTLEIGSIKAITGGGSKKTLIVALHNAHHLPNTVVIRADQASGVVESTVSDEYQLIEKLYAEGLPVPQPFASETDASIIGAPFVVVSCIEGRNIGDHVDVYEPSRSFGIGLARAMGKMHRIPSEQFGDKIVGSKTTTLERVHQDIASFETVWRNSGHPSIALEMGYAWLKQHLQFSEGRRALNHCDLACHNMLAKDGELIAILDWETTIIGNPAHDLAYAYVQVVQCMPWEDFLAEYEKAGGTIPSAAEFDFYRLWTACWRMSFLFIAQSFFHSGMSSSVVLAYGAQHLYQRINHDLHKVLNDIYERY
jgi:aminoglycoside phosphotransferase (APT) family kinase protein